MNQVKAHRNDAPFAFPATTAANCQYEVDDDAESREMKVLYAWELGGGLGHLTTAIPVLQHCAAEGHETVLATQDLQSAARLLAESSPIKLMQAPLWPRNMPTSREISRSYPEILLKVGYGDQRLLKTMIAAWDTLFEAIAPDLVFFDFAPTALLAARRFSFYRCAIGTGFTQPPLTTPLPSYLPADKSNISDREATEKKLLTTISGAQTSQYESVAAVLAADFEILTTWPQLDHYPDRKNGHYAGTPDFSAPTIVPVWRHPEKIKIFAYMNGDYPHLTKMINILLDAETEIILYSPRMPPSVKSNLSAEDLQLMQGPVSVPETIKKADIVICHGGHGTVAEAAKHGKPTIFIPLQIEQLVLARKIHDHAGILSQHWSKEDLVSILKNLRKYSHQSALSDFSKHSLSNNRLTEYLDRVLASALHAKSAHPPINNF